MSFATAFKDILADPDGEPLLVDIQLTLNDGGGGAPSTKLFPTLVTAIDLAIFGHETVLAINPVTRKREVDFGAIQGGAWQVKITNNNGWWSGYDVQGCWCVIIGKFTDAALEEVFASGKIMRVSYESDGTIMLEIQDTVMDVLNYQLPRDMRFQQDGWLSPMRVESKDQTSDSYDSDELTALDAASFVDETFVVEFTTATAYKVILEDGDETQTSNISTDFSVDNVAGDSNVLEIASAGWGSTYVTGDRFVFYTSEERTDANLTPVNMVIHLIDTVMGLAAFDVVSAAYFAKARHDTANWTSKASDFDDYTAYGINGTYKKGTRVSQLIQDALKIIHGSIYPSEDGRIALWVLDDVSTLGVELNGDPGQGVVDILDGSRSEVDVQTLTNQVTFKYLSLVDGQESTYTSIDDGTTWPETRAVDVNISWECTGPAIESAANIYISRFSEPLQRYFLNTTLAGAAAEIGKQLRFSDSTMEATLVQTDVVNISTDMMGNAAQVSCYVDPVVLEDYARVGTATIGGSEVVW